MRKSVWTKILCVIAAVMMLLAGCDNISRITSKFHGRGDTVTLNSEETWGVYRLSRIGNKLQKTTCEFDHTNAEKLIQSCIDNLSRIPDDESLKPVLADNVGYEKYIYDPVTKTVTLYFNKNYQKLDQADELLIRAGIVKTLSQFTDEIQSVCFTVNNKPMRDEQGELLRMRGNDFVDNIGESAEYACENYVTLYYMSENGILLDSEEVLVRYVSKINLETAILNSLISGPISKNLYAVLPENLKINSVSVKENICYVDVNEAFLKPVNKVSYKLTVYAIVNSITQNTSAEKVQFLINGEIYTEPVEDFNIDVLFEPNGDLVVDSERFNREMDLEKQMKEYQEKETETQMETEIQTIESEPGTEYADPVYGQPEVSDRPEGYGDYVPQENY